jgi:serine/threonine protein phosphatase PrpC
MSETLKLQTTSRVSSPRLYIGETDSERESLHSALGEIEVSTVGSYNKPGPNEDSAAVIPVGDGAIVLVVADGVGGLPGGRAAANTAVDMLRETLSKAAPETLRTAILDGIEMANTKLLSQGNGSATTIAVAEIRPGIARSYHVGDSAIWVCGQRGRLKMQTTAHSPVGFAVEAGLLKETEALNHAHLHLISNVVGSNEMRIEMGPELRLASRDTVMVASDGLLDNLMQHEIVRLIRKGPLAKSMDGITELSLRRMHEPTAGRPSKQDDYTAILYRQQPPPRKPRTPKLKNKEQVDAPLIAPDVGKNGVKPSGK